MFQNSSDLEDFLELYGLDIPNPKVLNPLEFKNLPSIVVTQEVSDVKGFWTLGTLNLHQPLTVSLPNAQFRPREMTNKKTGSTLQVPANTLDASLFF